MDINVSFPEKLRPCFENLQSNQYDVIVLRGGRGSGKSISAANIAVLESFIDDGVILCGREIQKSIAASMYSSIVSEIKNLGCKQYFSITNKEIKNKLTGASILFAGLTTNITSIKSLNKLRVVIVDEAENVSQNSWDVLRPTPRYGNVRLYVVFNPRFESDATWQEFVVNGDEKTLDIEINYYDNPFFPESLDNQRKRDLARGDIARYNWIWLGKFLEVTEASVFGKRVKIRHFEYDKDSFGSPLIGIDWGFSTDPTAVVECYAKGRILYVKRAAGELRLKLNATAAWLITKVPKTMYYQSRADCSRPETINLVSEKLKLIKACKKWTGCAQDGVAFIQSFDEILVHPDCQADCAPELMSYSYKLDENKQVTNILRDDNNHYADAMRYALEPLIKNHEQEFFVAVY